MNIRHAIVLLACAAPFSAALPAAANPSVALDSAVFVERGSPTSGRLLEPASRLNRGDRVVYIVNWYRMGGAGSFTVTNPLPRAVAYQGSANGEEQVSVDGGKSWGKLGELRTGSRIATPEDVTHVRWQVDHRRAALGSGRIAYSAIVR
ncbi:hypothetical protein [Novosphingobium sp.]|uniref:hypothetical protein n=1 Tax=Novosphingobium sp. TaxID=1874826 RepID=UPI00273310A9|nr:hypothetical protein [Novosphingobium sp.]MDP3907185.1 hypothetical protein [Novosphingobium sp.]